jgi:peptidoglycan/LPS O-acetylase OafA/YrhL
MILKQTDHRPDLPVPLNPRYLSLDIWRGLACLMIVILHSSFYVRYNTLTDADISANVVGSSILFCISRMGIGVHLFFVISGYCIAATADASRRKPYGMRHYFRRRLRRILPPYWVALLLTAILVSLLWTCGFPEVLSDADSPIPHPKALSGMEWFGNVTLTETWLHHFVGNNAQLQLGPAWSLCYEEQFYIACGLILLVSSKRFFTGVVAITAVTCVAVSLSVVYSLSAIQGFFFDGHWLLFAVGMLVYYTLNYTEPASYWLLFGILCGFTALIAIVRYGFLNNSDWDIKNRVFEFLAACVFGLVLLALRSWDTQISTSNLLRPLAICGSMCYSLYLIHWPITKLISHICCDLGLSTIWETLLVTIPLATIASLGAAWLFHLAIERRFLNARVPSVDYTSTTRQGEPCSTVGFDSPDHVGAVAQA